MDLVASSLSVSVAVVSVDNAEPLVPPSVHELAGS